MTTSRSTSATRSTRCRRTSRGALDNVAVVIEDENREEPDLFGLFDQPEYMPAKISIYRSRSRRSSPTRPSSRSEIRITVLHELAHYFGMDEDRIAELGYD